MRLSDRLNRDVSVLDVLESLTGTTVEAFRKFHCPFGEFSHSDLGVDPCVRYYEDSNSIYCFRCCRVWSPVSLLAEYKDIPYFQATQLLSDASGIKEVFTVDELIQKLQMIDEDVLDLSSVLKAFNIFVLRVAKNSTVVYTPEYRSFLEDLIQSLTVNNAFDWIESAKVLFRSKFETV